MKHRGLFYFVFLSLFLYVAVFSDIVVLKNNKGLSVYKQIPNTKKTNAKNFIVETFIETKKPKNPKYISNLNSKEQGKITKSKNYSYYTDIRYFSQVVPKKKSEIEKGSEASESEFIKDDKKQSKKPLINPLPNFYTRKQVSINLNSEGFVGLSAEKKPYTQYLLILAKKIFYNWVRFLPAEQIRKALIVSNSKNGVLAGTVALYFNKDSMHYSVMMAQPYYSINMNNLTIRSFEYLRLPAAPKDVKLRVVMIRLTVNANTLRAEANFKFDLYYKDKKVSQ